MEDLHQKVCSRETILLNVLHISCLCAIVLGINHIKRKLLNCICMQHKIIKLHSTQNYASYEDGLQSLWYLLPHISIIIYMRWMSRVHEPLWRLLMQPAKEAQPDYRPFLHYSTSSYHNTLVIIVQILWHSPIDRAVLQRPQELKMYNINLDMHKT